MGPCGWLLQDFLQQTRVAQWPAVQARESHCREVGLGLGSKPAGQLDCSGHRIPPLANSGILSPTTHFCPWAKRVRADGDQWGTLISSMVISTQAATTPSSSFTENLRLNMKILPKIRVRSEVALSWKIHIRSLSKHSICTRCSVFVFPLDPPSPSASR